MSRPDRGSRGPIALALALVALSLATPPSPPVGAAAQKGFETPEAAATALVDAVRSGNRNALLEILGSGAAPLVYSGDQVADRNAGERFVADYDRGHHLEGGGGKVVLYVGDDDFPFPIPLVPDGTEWRFDTKAGKDEILNRRIGRNELSAIEVVLAYVDAQREYYSKDRNADGLREYAQRFASTPGQHDGLSWDAKPGEDPSPLGPLVARARAEGYPGARRAGGGVPYHGYYYRILTSQGPGALGGAYDYIAHGRMIGGFALVAFPAQYGVSGVMTFIVNHDGVVYQKDLGPDTDAIARAMKQFNPDSSWKQI